MFPNQCDDFIHLMYVYMYALPDMRWCAYYNKRRFVSVFTITEHTDLRQ